ncbi:hypothetical protein CBM2600_A10113 [Cupriavidus taiwanensis]|nr:hypothetical protein CBM2600_A10113 [Cupriavidus taiwanensis]
MNSVSPHKSGCHKSNINIPRH